MENINSWVEFTSGSPQFRISEVSIKSAPVYQFYDQSDLTEDLIGLPIDREENKHVRTFDRLSTLEAGNIIFSLISGTSSIVSKNHSGYLYTQNYIKLSPKKELDGCFLVYLLNENKGIKRQFQKGIQGSATMKYTVKQLRDLNLPTLPSLEKQKSIDSIYFKQLHKQALKERVAKLETKVILARLEGKSHE